MTKEDDEDFENSIKCWICDNDYVDGNVKLREYGHIDALPIEISTSMLN